MLTWGERLNASLEQVSRRPFPALVALLAGSVLGLGGGGAYATVTRDAPVAPPPAAATAPLSAEHRPEKRDRAGARAGRRPSGHRPRERSKPSRPVRSRSLAAGVEAVQRLYDAGGADFGFAAVPLDDAGALAVAGSSAAFEAMSTMKVPVAATFLGFKAERGQPVTGRDASLIDAAISQSSNEAARALYKHLLEDTDPRNPARANAELQAMVQSSGAAPLEALPPVVDPSIDNSVAFGTARWSAGDAALFFRALGAGCLIAAGDAKRLLNAMAGVQGQGRFGVSEVYRQENGLFFKSGWAAGPGIVGQAAIVGRDDAAFAVAVLTNSPSFASGAALVERIVRTFAAKGPRPEPTDVRLPRDRARC